MTTNKKNAATTATTKAPAKPLAEKPFSSSSKMQNQSSTGTATLERARCCCSSNTTTSQRNNKTTYTRVYVKYDAGFPNALFLRGQGANLSWDKGIMMRNIGADEWVWETDQHFSNCEFKVLLNDDQYETGNNHEIKCGGSLKYTPSFN